MPKELPALQGSADDLIEVYFNAMQPNAWRALFQWLLENSANRITLVDCQHGRLEKEQINCDLFLSAKMSYIIDIICSNGFELQLSLIEDDELTIDIEVEDISEEISFALFLEAVEEIAQIIQSKDYFICPEFKKEQAFYINGRFI